MTPQACAALVEAGDPDRFLATMAAPAGIRDRLWPLYAANLEIARAPWSSPEPMVSEMRLQWWIDTIGDLARGGSRAGHPVTEALVPVLRERPGVADLLIGIAEARRWDAWREAFADRAAFDAYLDRTAGNLMWAAALCLDAPAVAEAPVRDCGWAAGLAAFLQAVPELESRGRVPLVDGRPGAVADLAAAGLARLAMARSGLHFIPAGARPVLFTAWQAAALLAQSRRRPERVVRGELGLSPLGRRARLIRAAVTGRI